MAGLKNVRHGMADAQGRGYEKEMEEKETRKNEKEREEKGKETRREGKNKSARHGMADA